MTTPGVPANVKPLSISTLTNQVKNALEASFSSVWVAGEVATVSNASSGHIYVTLKDAKAILNAVLFSVTAQTYRAVVKVGVQVIVRGRMTMYGPQGRTQLVIEDLYEAGVGAQDLALRKLKEKLHKLGYFAKERKRPLPRYPKRLALVASRHGAAVRDMLEIISRRWRHAELWVVHTLAQGKVAATDIASTLSMLNGFAGIDAILLARGGGSREDLAVFDEEIVATAIFKSRVPVISAVGHEIDVTIADLVADCRAATPSEAAELATPDCAEMIKRLRAGKDKLTTLLLGKLQANKERWRHTVQRRIFRYPFERVRDEQRRLDETEERLGRAMQVQVRRLRQRLDAMAGKLHSLSPLNVLARGYSLTRTLPDQRVVRSVNEVAPGDAIEIIVADGRIQAEVRDSSESTETES
jgi:exodeoxyribonuclease VII large subunit